MFPRISLPHCVLFLIRDNSQYYGELQEHEKSTVCGPGHVLSDSGCATDSWDFELFGQPFCDPASICDPANQTGGRILVRTNVDIVAACSERAVTCMFHFIYLIPILKCWPAFCYSIFDHVLTYRLCFAHSLLRPGVKVLPQVLLSQFCPPTHLYHLPLMVPAQRMKCKARDNGQNNDLLCSEL